MAGERRLPDRPHGIGDVVLGHQHEVRRVTERDEQVTRRDAPDRPRETAFDEGGDDSLADTALVTGLVDDDDAPDLAPLTAEETVGPRERLDAAQYEQL